MKLPTVALLATCSLAIAQERAPFDRWDKDGDGKLSRDEVPEAPRRQFDKVDTNHDGWLSREEDQAFRKRNTVDAQAATEGIKIQRDLHYAGNEHPRQRLDLLLPEQRRSEKPLPVIAFIHGGAWRSGDKRSGLGRLAPLVKSGEFAGLSIGYRLSADATWPAQIHDCKAAIRWIRANATKYNLDPERIAVWGSSAGGHLVAMLGVSGGVEALEGDLGEHLDQDSRVRCVVNFFGPSELLTMGDYPSTIEHNAPASPESLLVGGALQENKAAARSASPMTYISADDAPILHVHGTADQLVPYPQSTEFNKKLVAAGVSSHLITVEGGGHGNFGKASGEVDRLVREFLALHLLDAPGKEIEDHTLPSE